MTTLPTRPVSTVRATRFLPALGIALTLALGLAGCGSVPLEERKLALSGGEVVASAEGCSAWRKQLPPAFVRGGGELDGRALRIVSWNLKKGEEKGWQADLARYAADHDVLLLQEAVLSPEVRRIVEGAGHAWTMAGAFAVDGEDRGVMVAARVAPLDSCTLRSFEPLAVLPKSAIVTRFRLAASAQTLALANLHGINFTLGLERFGEQLDDLGAELERHRGPIVLAGDFNTWSAERQAVLAGVVKRLALEPVALRPDERVRVFGHPLDHFFVRGLGVTEARSTAVRSSDHNPILTTLWLR